MWFKVKLHCNLFRGVLTFQFLSTILLIATRFLVEGQSDLDSWVIKAPAEVQRYKDTSYFCTLHKSPSFLRKTHITALEVNLENPLAEKHTHRIVLHRCLPPPYDPNVNLTEILDPWLEYGGGDCHDSHEPAHQLFYYCSTYFYAWAKGAGPLLLPDHVGFPVGDAGRPEYFMLEVHYDNPDLEPNIQYTTEVRLFHTEKLREYDGGILYIGQNIHPGLVVPPNTKDFVQVGHCSSECTKYYFPNDGLTVFNIAFHSHFSGRKMKLRHFRAGQELPWLAYDENYNFSSQQSRPLPEEVKIIQEDHMTIECTYDTTWMTPPSATYGGGSIRHEMCAAFVLYYPQMSSMDRCESVFEPLSQLYSKFGIEDMVQVNMDKYIVTAPASLSELTYMEVLTHNVTWTPGLVSEIQDYLRFSHHLSMCFSYSTPKQRIFGRKPNNNGSSQNGTKIAVGEEKELPQALIEWTTYPTYTTHYSPIGSNCNLPTGVGGAIGITLSLTVFIISFLCLVLRRLL